jgi:hypothetical protein
LSKEVTLLAIVDLFKVDGVPGGLSCGLSTGNASDDDERIPNRFKPEATDMFFHVCRRHRTSMLIWIEDDCSWSRSFTHLATGNLCTTIMHLLRYELYHYQPVSMASPPMAEKDEYAMAHCLDEQTQMIT